MSGHDLGEWVSFYLHPIGRVAGRIIQIEGSICLIEYILHQEGESKIATTWQGDEGLRAI